VVRGLTFLESHVFLIASRYFRHPILVVSIPMFIELIPILSLTID